MPRLPGSSLRIGVSREALALVRVGPFSAPTVLAQAAVAGEWQPALDSALAALLDDADAYRGWPVAFVLADDLVRFWTVVPPDRATRIGDLRAAAQLRFRQLFGEPDEGWELAASYHCSEPFLAAAMPRWLLAALLGAAQARGMSLAAIEPHFVAAWNAWRASVRQDAWLGLIHEGLLTLGAVSGGRLLSVRPVRIPARVPSHWLVTHARREALLLGLPEPREIAVCGALPEGWEAQAGWRLLPGRGDGGAAGARLALAGVAA